MLRKDLSAADRSGEDVDVFHWNPRRRRFKGPLRRLPLSAPVNNFGDLLGPVIVDWMRAQCGCVDVAVEPARLLSVGSILAFARDGDTVWGSGVNGKVAPEAHTFTTLDVRAVRGPLTHAFLRERGIADRELPYGDPGLLLGLVRPDLLELAPRFSVTVVPNLNDVRPRRRGDVIGPRRPLETVLRRIAESELVVGSSLHALVVAEALGIPARAVRSEIEPEFKYADYYRGSGRDTFAIADSIDEAIALGGMEPPHWSPERLLASFPHDLWVSACNTD